MALEQLIKRHRLRMTVKRVDINPNIDDVDMPGASHWRCTLWNGAYRYTAHYSMGRALSGEPSIADVLGCLAVDARSADESFADWCSECGYDTDSRKAERTYKACKAIARNLERVLGRALYTELLNTERED
jgi:hypothetical protein